jgi:hypothetical protein
MLNESPFKDVIDLHTAAKFVGLNYGTFAAQYTKRPGLTILRFWGRPYCSLNDPVLQAWRDQIAAKAAAYQAAQAAYQESVAAKAEVKS